MEEALKSDDVFNKPFSIALHFHLFQEFFSLDDISKTDIYEMFRNSVKRGPHHSTPPSYTRKLGRLSFVVRRKGVAWRFV